VFVGCEIPSSSVNKITSAYNFPNPFCPSCETNNNTNIRVVFENNSSATKVSIEIKIVNIVNKLVWYFKTERAVIDGSNNIDVLWSGRNNEGEIVSQGVYDAKIIVQVLESSTNSGGDTLSTKVKIGVE
jgi:flagellar hook assembly protein FlgD